MAMPRRRRWLFCLRFLPLVLGGRPRLAVTFFGLRASWRPSRRDRRLRRAPTLASARPADRADGARSRLGYVAPMDRSLALLSATDDDLPETEVLRLALREAVAEGGGLGGLVHLREAATTSALHLGASTGLPPAVLRRWQG